MCWFCSGIPQTENPTFVHSLNESCYARLSLHTWYISFLRSVVNEVPVGLPPFGMVYRNLGMLLCFLTSSGLHLERISFRAFGIIPCWSLGTLIMLQPKGLSYLFWGGGKEKQTKQETNLSHWVYNSEIMIMSLMLQNFSTAVSSLKSRLN